MRRRTWAGRLVGLAARAFPGGAREREEVVAAFERAYRRRRVEGGPLRAWSYAARTAVDVLRAGWSERRRGAAAGRRVQAAVPETEMGGGGGGMGRMGRWTWEVRYALRVLTRSPGFTLAAVAILALGIGGNAAVFSALETVLLAPPPYPEPDRLVLPKIAHSEPGQRDTTLLTFSWTKLERRRAGTEGVFEAVAGYSDRTATLTAPGDAGQVGIEVVEPGYFELLGVRPSVGRSFARDEGGAEPAGVAVLGHELWTARFGGDPSAVGRDVVLGGERLTVVGVAPRGFRGLTGTAELWIAVGDVGALDMGWLLEADQAHWLNALARLRPGASVADARARVERIGREIEAELPMAEPGEWVGARLLTFEEVRTNPGARASVVLLTVAAALVLLIAVANLAGLLVARGTRRRRETAVRLALGSGRGGLVRSLLVETLILAGLGGLAGLGVAWLGIEGIAAAWPSDFVSSGDAEMVVVDVTRLSLDGGVLAFSAALTLATGLLFGVLPALRQSGLDLVPALKEAARGSRGGTGGVLTRRLLVSAQAAVAVVLLVGAGLLGATLLKLQAVDRGFDPERMLVLRYNALGTGAFWETAGEEDTWAFHGALLERVRGLPGVETATISTSAPYSGWGMRTQAEGREGAPPLAPADRPDIGVLLVAPGYFDAVGARMTAGRDFAGADLEAPPRVAVLNRTAVDALFDDVDPVGRRFSMGVRYEGGEGKFRVVGVVDDILQSAPDREPMATAYLPLPADDVPSATLLVRTRTDPFDVVPAVREIARSLDPSVPLYGVTTARDLEAEAVGDTRVLLGLLGIFAAVALVLAATGVYGVVAYTVANRRPELGLRMALGARSTQVSGMVLGEGLAAAGLGVVVGLAVAYGGTRLLSSFLWGVGERDPVTFVGGAALLLAVAALASWIPARRATRVEPAEVLRSE